MAKRGRSDFNQYQRQYKKAKAGEVVPGTNFRKKGWSKFGNRITWVDGIRFASKREAEYYLIYVDEQRRGKIKDLQMQVKFRFEIEGKLMFTYVADFTYIDPGTERTVVVDVKGVETPVFRLKWKIIKKFYEKLPYDFKVMK